MKRWNVVVKAHGMSGEPVVSKWLVGGEPLAVVETIINQMKVKDEPWYVVEEITITPAN